LIINPELYAFITKVDSLLSDILQSHIYYLQCLHVLSIMDCLTSNCTLINYYFLHRRWTAVYRMQYFIRCVCVL